MHDCHCVVCMIVCVYVTMREAVELAQHEGWDLEVFFPDSGSEENTVDSGEFVPVNLKADSSDSKNDIFIFIIGIHATSRIKLKKQHLCLDSSCFAVATEEGM